MSLTLPDKWLWDFWFAVDSQGAVHVFYLQAQRSLVDPVLRHRNASIGHATSDNLIDWTLRSDALEPASSPAWDDASTWTGSIIERDGRWHLFYTGTSEADGGLVQRIGRATSDDLERWERCTGPVIEADPRWYERLGAGWPDEAWRDPWVFRGDDGMFHMLITARANTGEHFERGCIGHAQSRDLVEWEVTAPITTPGPFGQLEVPQVHRIGGEWHLLFCCDAESQSPTEQPGGRLTGTFYVAGPSELGPFDVSQARPLEADPNGSRYAGRVIERCETQYLSWLRAGADGEFVGALSDPSRIERRGEQVTLR